MQEMASKIRSSCTESHPIAGYYAIALCTGVRRPGHPLRNEPPAEVTGAKVYSASDVLLGLAVKLLGNSLQHGL